MRAGVDIKESATGRWGSILAALGVEESFLVNRHGPCPICGGRDRWRWDDKGGRGTFFCSGGCGAGDGFKLLMLLRGVDFKGAVKLVEEVLPTAPKVTKARERSAEEKTAALRRMWEAAKPVSDEGPVAKYLSSRAIYAHRSPSLREGPMRYYDENRKFIGEFPAMIGRIASVDGKGVSLHVTYLTAEGKKADLPSPKKVMQPVGAVIGSAVQLFKAEGDALGVAEGIETALSSFEQFDMPVWAAISAEGMAAFTWPAHVKRLVIFGDHDDSFTGHWAAYTLARRARVKGLTVEVRVPEEAGDWNDVAKRRAA